MSMHGKSADRFGNTVPEDLVKIDFFIADFVNGELFIIVGVKGRYEFAGPIADLYNNGYILSVLEENGVISFAFKYGNLPWCDAQYSPHLNAISDIPTRECIKKAGGLWVNIMLVVESPKIILEKQSILWNNPFVDSLMHRIEGIMLQPFDHSMYLKTVADIRNKYTSEELGLKNFNNSYIGFIQNA